MSCEVSKRDGWVMVQHPELGLLVEAVQPGEKKVEQPLSNPLQPLVLQPSSKEEGCGARMASPTQVWSL